MLIQHSHFISSSDDLIMNVYTLDQLRDNVEQSFVSKEKNTMQQTRTQNSEHRTSSNTLMVIFQKCRTGNMGKNNLYLSLIRRQGKTKKNKRSQIETLR